MHFLKQNVIIRGGIKFRKVFDFIVFWKDTE